tara:strand:- start:4840 stop:8664 length:3825 start_codon:yes stop_codon:yes gene_type:complete
MLYDLDRSSGVEINTKTKSRAVKVLDPKDNGIVNLTTSEGTLIVNGETVGTVADVTPGDIFQVELESASEYVFTKFAVVKQDGVFAAIYIQTTTYDPASEFNPDYLQLQPYEVLPDSTWSPIASPSYRNFQTGQNFILENPSGSYSLSRLVLCDYHRDCIYFCNPTEGLTHKVVNHLTKPAKSVDYYSLQGLRIAHLVLYRAQNIVAFFDDYDLVHEANLNQDAIDIQVDGSLLYVLFKNRELKTYSIAEDFSLTLQNTISANVLHFYVADANIAMLQVGKFVDFDSTEYTVLSTADTFAYNETLDSFAIGHRSVGNITFISGDLGNREKTYLDTQFLYIAEVEAFADNFYASGEFYGILRFNLTSSTFYPSDVPCYGLQDFNNFLLVSSLYPDMDRKVTTVDITPNPFSFSPQLWVGVGGAIYSDEIVVGGLENVARLAVPVISGLDIVLEVNDVEVNTSSIDVTNGDRFRVIVTPNIQQTARFDLPVVLGSAIAYFTMLPTPGEILPQHSGFGPVFGEPSTLGSTVERNFPFLQGSDSIFVTVDVGNIYVNRIDMGKSANVRAGDLVSFTHTIPSARCRTAYQTITYGNNLFETIVAYKQNDNQEFALIGLGLPGTNIEDIWQNQFLNHEVTTSDSVVRTATSVDLQITNSYNAVLIKNGTPVGQSSTFVDGDKLALSLTTSSYYNLEHRVTVSSCGHAVKWQVYTAPDLFIDPFTLGDREGLALTDYIVSNEFVVSGLGYRQKADITIPYGTVLFVNGVRYTLPADKLDYRNVLREDLKLEKLVENGMRIRLGGYPRNTYGTTQLVPLTIGFTTGMWTLKTYYVDPKGADLLERPAIISDRHSDFTCTCFSFSGKTQPIFEDLLSSFEGKYNPELVSTQSTSFAVATNALYVPEANVFNAFDLNKPTTDSKPGLITVELPQPLAHSIQYGESSLLASTSYNAAESPAFIRDLWLSLHEQTGYVDKDYHFPAYMAYPEIKVMRNTHFRNTNIKMQTNPAESFTWEMYSFELSDVTQLDLIHYAAAGFFEVDSEALAAAVVFPSGIGTSFEMAFTKIELPETNLFYRPFQVHQGTPFVEIAPLWVKPDPDSIWDVDPIWLVPGANAVWDVDPIWIKEPSTTLISVDRNWQQGTANSFNYVADNWIANQGLDRLNESAQTFDVQSQQAVNSVVQEFISLGLNSVKVFIPEYTTPSYATYYFYLDKDVFTKTVDELPLQQVFDSEAQALSDALSYGLSESKVRILPYFDKFIWVHAMPCENMCFTCPPTGYIHGG